MSDLYTDFSNMASVEFDRSDDLAGAIGGRVKRIFDIVVSLAMLVIFAPLMLILAAAIWMKDGAPIFFRHERIGYGGTRFSVWKFRTMCKDSQRVLRELLDRDPEARRSWEADQKLRDDPRILGAVGHILRRTSLDELPQLFNVLRGEMSLVGPRPIVDDEVRRYGNAFGSYIATRPGITGPWQVSGRNDVGYDTRVALDQNYVENWSLFSDLKIMIQTVIVMLTARGAY